MNEPNRILDQDLQDEKEQACRVCGCTWTNACAGGCYWVEQDLCSSCAYQDKEMKSLIDYSWLVEDIAN